MGQRAKHGRRERARCTVLVAPRTAEAPITRETLEISDALHWYSLRTEPRMGDRALAGIEAAQAVPIVPRVSEIVTRQGRRVVRTRQLLLRQVFVGVQDTDHLNRIAAISGVASVVSYPVLVETSGNIEEIENRPARLDPEILQRFVNALARGEIVQPFGVKEGDVVRIRSGPFANFPATVERILPHDMVRVGVAVFGRSTPLDLPVGDISV